MVSYDHALSVMTGESMLWYSGPVSNYSRIPFRNRIRDEYVASTIFFIHLTFSFGESRERSVTIKEVDPETLKALLDFCSTSRITITPDNVYDIFNAANRYLTISYSTTRL